MAINASTIDDLPGAELIRPGIDDILAGRASINAAAVRMAATRLRELGLSVPDGQVEAEIPGHILYRRIVESGVADPYSRYNAVLRRITSFIRALEVARRS